MNRQNFIAKNVVFAFCTFTWPFLAHAETAICQGIVTTTAQHAPGYLVVTVGGSRPILVCSFNEQQHSISAAGCRHMAAVAMLAVTTGKVVTLYVDNAPTTGCTDIPSWHVSNTRYFNINQ